jgi:hypothetical protein
VHSTEPAERAVGRATAKAKQQTNRKARRNFILVSMLLIYLKTRQSDAKAGVHSP